MICKKIKSNGETCKNPALTKDIYCYWHSKKVPEAEKFEHRSKGGKNKIIVTNGYFPLFKLNSIKDVLKLNSSMINQVLQNELDLRIATGLTYMLNLQCKGIETATIEKRLSVIEKQMDIDNSA